MSTEREQFVEALDHYAETCALAGTLSVRAMHRDRRTRVLALYDAATERGDKLAEVVKQVVEDVEAVKGAADLPLFYERMQANAVDARALLAKEETKNGD